MKNIAIGALHAATHRFSEDTFLTAIRQALKDKCAMVAVNEEAFALGGSARQGSGLF